MLIRLIEVSDNPEVARVIRAVMQEYGAVGSGFSIMDPEVDQMFETYSKPGHVFYVIMDQQQVVGCGGIGPLVGGDQDTCELRKMYFMPAARGRGMGKRLLQQCLQDARRLGYQQCYLETLSSMKEARGLYEHLGFQRLSGPMGKTGHFGCDDWYLRSLHS